MKKSKLIVPAALAVMLLSTAASVTGTVAWFTANRAVDINASQFEVTKTDGNLAVQSTALENCTVGADDKTVSIAQVNSVNLKLTDASVDIAKGATEAACGTVYKKGDYFDQYDLPTSYSVVTAAQDYASDTDGVVLCVSWKFTFTYEFLPSAETDETVHLFFDIEKSSFTQVDSEDPLDTGKGFRVGIANASNAIVFADKEDTNNCNFITGNASAAPKVTYTHPVGQNPSADSYNAPQYYKTADITDANGDGVDDSDSTKVLGKVKEDAKWSGAYTAIGKATCSGTNVQLVEKDDVYAADDSQEENAFKKAKNGDANMTSRGDYMGTFTKAANSSTATIEVFCFAWFEGTDPYVVNASDMNIMSTLLAFYTRK